MINDISVLDPLASSTIRVPYVSQVVTMEETLVEPTNTLQLDR